MDLSKVKEWKIPEGNVISVQDASGEIMWMAPVVTVNIQDYTGSGTIDASTTWCSLCFSTNPSPFSSQIVNSENLNSYSQRLYVRLGELEDEDNWSDAPAEAYGSCYIASGSQMSTICDDIMDHINQGSGYTWDEVRTKILNTTPEVFEELTVYGGNTYEIDLSKYTPTQMMGNPKYIEPNYPLYIICGNGYAPNEEETATWDLKSQTVDASKTVIPVITNANIAGSMYDYLLGTPNVSWMSWDTTIETDATICLVVDENTSTADRSGTVSLYMDFGMTTVDTVTITQKGKSSSGVVTKQKPYWNLKSSYSVNYIEQDVTPEIIVTDPDNVGWNIEAEDKNLREIGMIGSSTWNISGEGSESTGYLISVFENDKTLAKLHTVTLSSEGQIISTCIISQSGKPSSGGGIDPGEIIKPPVSEEEFSLSATTLTLAPAGTAKSLTINYSGSWTILYAAEGTSDGTTLKFSQTSGTGNTTVRISASIPNAGSSVRAWLVTVKTSTGLTKTCRVYQQSSIT